jgi:hypothetical protein
LILHVYAEHCKLTLRGVCQLVSRTGLCEGKRLHGQADVSLLHLQFCRILPVWVLAATQLSI